MKTTPQIVSTNSHLSWYSKKLPLILMGIILLASCGDKKHNADKKSETETTTAYKTQAPSPEQNEKELLCKINGEEWYYTEVRCRKILSTDYTPREKYVLNFKNADTKAGESITLMYNAKTLKLEYVDAAIQNPHDEAGVRAFFGIQGYTDEELAQIKDIGILTDVSGDSISGIASFTIARNSRGVYSNELDVDISVIDLKFSNLSYEDVSGR